jgi:hypothetical protein
LERYIKKYALHAAAANNRPTPNSFDNVSLQAAEDQMRHAVMLTHQIGKLIDNLILTEVPHPQFDQLAAWEHSLFTPAIKDQLFEYWTERMELWRTWSETYWSWDRFYLSDDYFISIEPQQQN